MAVTKIRGIQGICIIRFMLVSFSMDQLLISFQLSLLMDQLPIYHSRGATDQVSLASMLMVLEIRPLSGSPKPDR
jgi:hypothetical protein